MPNPRHGGIHIKHHTKFWHLLTGLLPILLAVLAVGGLLLVAQPASAATPGTCIQDVWKAHGNKQNLTCTAQDVTLSEVTNICVDDGQGGCTPNNACNSGQPVTFTADFRMVLTADTRYDIGFYIATDGGGADGALTGTCAATQVTEQNAPVTFRNLDASPDSCGDIEGPEGTPFNPQIVRFTLTTQCIDPDGDGFLNLPFCTTWRQPGSNEECTTVNDVFPGSPSKCNCGTLNVDIFIETATIEVTKTNLSGNVPETGGSVTCSVAVKNLAQVSDVTLDTLTDSLYGNITTTGHDGITATTCAVGAPPGPIAAGATYTCEFTVSVGPGDTGQTVTDIVTACGTDEFGHTNLCDTDDASYTYSDVSTAPALTKTATAAAACRVDVTFAVAVTNNSTVDTLTVNSLTDNQFGDITAVQGNVISTTCVTGGTIAPSGAYSCSFVGRVTTNCTASHTNNVTGGLTDDDQVNYSPTDPDGGATVTVTVTFGP